MTRKAANEEGTGREATAPVDVDSFVAFNRDAIESVGELNKRLTENFAVCREEAVSFFGRRLKHDFDMPQQLMACKTPQEVYDVYMDFFQTARKDYLEEVGRLAELSTNIASSSLGVMERQVEKAAKVTNGGGSAAART